MSEGPREHVSERFARLLALYRKADGGEWGGHCGTILDVDHPEALAY